jgi:hypothetical protein
LAICSHLPQQVYPGWLTLEHDAIYRSLLRTSENSTTKLSEKSTDAQNVASRRQRSARSGSNTRVEHTLRESLAPLFRQFLEGLFSELELSLNGALGSSFPLGMRSAYRALYLVTAWNWCSTIFGFGGL